MIREIQNILITLIIAVAVVGIIYTIGNFIYQNQLDETIYEQCVETCDYTFVEDDEEMDCIKICDATIDDKYITK